MAGAAALVRKTVRNIELYRRMQDGLRDSITEIDGQIKALEDEIAQLRAAREQVIGIISSGPQPVDNAHTVHDVDSANNVNEREHVDRVNTDSNADNGDHVDSVGTVDTVGNANNVDHVNGVNTDNNVENGEHVDSVGTDSSVDDADSESIVDDGALIDDDLSDAGAESERTNAVIEDDGFLDDLDADDVFDDESTDDAPVFAGDVDGAVNASVGDAQAGSEPDTGPAPVLSEDEEIQNTWHLDRVAMEKRNRDDDVFDDEPVFAGDVGNDPWIGVGDSVDDGNTVSEKDADDGSLDEDDVFGDAFDDDDADWL